MCIWNSKQRSQLLLSHLERKGENSFQNCRKVVYRFCVALLPKLKSMGGSRFQYQQVSIPQVFISLALIAKQHHHQQKLVVLCRAGLKPLNCSSDLRKTWKAIYQENKFFKSY